MADTAEWITTAEAAELTGYHREHIRRLAVAGIIRAQRFGRDWQINPSDLLRYLAGRQAQGGKRGPKTGGG